MSHDKGNTIKTILETLEDELEYKVIGVSLDDDGEYVYSSKSFVRNTRDFGLPQNRPRVYIMAFSKRVYGKAIDQLTEGLPKGSDTTIFSSVNDVLEEVVDDKYYMASGYLETLKKHKARQISNGNGFGYCIVNKDDGREPIANTILATGGSGKERNLVFQPKEGVAGKVIPGKYTALNDEGIRVMTPKEWGRLQGFIGYAFMDNGTDRFSFPDDMCDGQKYKQFGNSVSIPVIEEMAKFMYDCLEKMNSCQEDIVEQLSLNRGHITKRDVIEALDITTNQANYLLRKMTQNGTLQLINHGRYAKYTHN
jgi:DNA (cytosine-5)-methyltransferase 1